MGAIVKLAEYGKRLGNARRSCSPTTVLATDESDTDGVAVGGDFHFRWNSVDLNGGTITVVATMVRTHR